MYRRPKFLEVLIEIRREMALEADYDVDLFSELARSGKRTLNRKDRTGQPLSVDPTGQNGKVAEINSVRRDN